MKPKNTKECDKRKNQISSKLYMVYISSNNAIRPVTKTLPSLAHKKCCREQATRRAQSVLGKTLQFLYKGETINVTLF